MTVSLANAPSAEALRRDIGPLGAAVLALNGIVGAGIFALPGSLAADFGSFSPLMILLFGLPVFLIALPLAELASLYDRTGGPVIYAREAFGAFASFQTGWTYTIARVSAFAANLTVFAAYAAVLAPALNADIARILLLAATTALFAVVNIVGVKRAVRALDALSILKIAPLLALALFAVARHGLDSGAPLALPHFSKVETASLLILYAFVGFETVLAVGGEARDAKRSIPRALCLTLLATILLYALVQFAYVAAMGADRGGEAPLAAFGEKLLGPAGALIITAAALFSVAGNLLGSMTSTPRIAYALARDKLLPGWLGAVDARHGTPANSILFYGALAFVLAASGTFAVLAVVSTVSRLFVYGLSLAALPVIRAKRGAPARVGLWKFLAPAVLALGLLFCLWAVAQTKIEAWRVFGALIVAGTALYAVARATASAKAPSPT